jgi:hypothetical protein
MAGTQICTLPGLEKGTAQLERLRQMQFRFSYSWLPQSALLKSDLHLLHVQREHSVYEGGQLTGYSRIVRHKTKFEFLPSSEPNVCRFCFRNLWAGLSLGVPQPGDFAAADGNAY